MSDKDLNFNNEQVVILNVGDIISVGLNAFTFINAFYNVVKYVCKRRINRLLIILFYTFVFINTMTQSFLLVYYIVTMNQ